MRYQAILRGNARAEAHAEPEAVAAALAEFAQTGRARLALEVRVTGEGGRLATRATAHWHVRANR